MKKAAIFILILQLVWILIGFILFIVEKIAVSLGKWGRFPWPDVGGYAFLSMFILPLLAIISWVLNIPLLLKSKENKKFAIFNILFSILLLGLAVLAFVGFGS